MKAEHKPLFRPDIINRELANFQLDGELDGLDDAIGRWDHFLKSPSGTKHKESEILHDFLTDIFCGILGYKRPSDAPGSYNFSREKYVEADGKFADGVIGRIADGQNKYIAAIEGKGPLDPIERPYKGRKYSAVDQCYKYAINLPCDWVIVTSTVETRLYHKGSDQLTYEKFLTADLATNTRVLKKFIFLLGAKRMVPKDGGRCHLYRLLEESKNVSKRLSKEYYTEFSNKRGELFRGLKNANPELEAAECLRCTQKILDRVLFCAICEDRGLLPANTLVKVFEHSNPYNPQGKWQNYVDLFNSIDKGNPEVDIPKYNGGLFASDEALNGLKVTDALCEIFKSLGEYDYRTSESIELDENLDQRQFIDVDILGHIFEQSITEIESIKNEKGGVQQAVKKNRFQTRAKIEGAYYTPAYITDFIVRSTVEATLEDRFQELVNEHLAGAKPKAKSRLKMPANFEVTELTKVEHTSLVNFWKDWQEHLKCFKVLDPACGSGAFLISAFDYLANTYQRCNEILAELTGTRSLFDLSKQILNNNLFGVDINEEAVEICKLSIWIKTADKGKVLTDLDKNIRVGNSIVDDEEVDEKAFKWEQEFKEILEQGGFDVLVGNPPYIRQELIKPFKPHLESKFKSYKGSADIYVYFLEKSINLMADDGRLGFITSGTFTRGGFADKYRAWFSENASFEKIVNFGENQPFENAEMVYPTISIVKKGIKRDKPPRSLFIKWNEVPEDLNLGLDELGIDCDERFYTSSEWRFQVTAISDLFNRLNKVGVSLKDFVGGRIYSGIKTGYNDAFIIDEVLKGELIDEDGKAAKLIGPLYRGEDLRPWYTEEEGRFLLFMKRNLDIDNYPSIKKHLETYRTYIEPKPDDWDGEEGWDGRKAGPYQWYELQDPIAYSDEFYSSKIIWPEIGKQPRFSWDSSGKLLTNKCHFLNTDFQGLLGILQSRVTWFLISQISLPLRLRGGLWQYQCIGKSMARLRVPKVENKMAEELNRLSVKATEISLKRYKFQEQILGRICSDFGGEKPKPNQKLIEWWKLDFGAFRSEVKKSFNTNIPVSERIEWEDALLVWGIKFKDLTSQLVEIESEINKSVYTLFGLSASEVEELEIHLKESMHFYELGNI